MTMTAAKFSASSKRSLVVGISFVAGLSLGVLASIAVLSDGPRKKLETGDVTVSDIHQSYSKSTNGVSTASSVDVGRFLEIFKHRSISEQANALHTILSPATEQELKDWWTEAQNIERGNHRKIAQNAILQSLTTINPREALRSVEDVSAFHTDALLMSVFSQWSVSQIDGAIEAAATVSAPRRKIALQAILETRDDLTESERHSIAIQLKEEELYLKFVSDAKASHSISEPKESWDILVNDDVDNSLQEESLAIVAEAWCEQDGFEVLSNIYAEFEDLTRKSDLVRVHLVRAIAHVDLYGALNYTRTLPEGPEQSNLSDIIVDEWARTDPLTALGAVSIFEPTLLASELEKQIGSVWAQTNPNELIESIEAISEEYRISPLETAFLNIARKDPLEAVTKLSSVASFVGNTSTIAKKIVLEWSRQEPDAAAEWIVNSFSLDDPQRRRLLKEVLPILARQDPNQAFELALKQPVPDEDTGLELQVITVLAREGDIELAKKLLPRVKENTKVSAFSEVGSAMVRESRTDEAVELGKDFTGTKQRNYFETVLYSWVETDPKQLYESLADLPSSSIKSIAAKALITRDRFQPYFNDDQINHTRTFLTTDDAASLKRFENR